jgi:hypothetical protein
LPIGFKPKSTTKTTPTSDPFAPLVTTTTMDPFSFVVNGTIGDPFQPIKPNTIVSITFPPTSDPPNNPFQPNIEITNPFAPASTIKPIFNPFSLGVQASNVSFNTIRVLTFHLAAISVPPSGYPNIFVLNITNGSTQWATMG